MRRPLTTASIIRPSFPWFASSLTPQRHLSIEAARFPTTARCVAAIDDFARVCPDGDVLVREGDDFKAAVEAAQPGARIFLTEGMHTWYELPLRPPYSTTSRIPRPRGLM